jgi:hypothetical protein
MTDAVALLKQWTNAVRIAHVGHSRAAAYYSRMHLILGVPVTVIAAAVGTSIFVNLSASDIWWAFVLTGLASMIAAILSGLQTFLNYSERSAAHAVAAAKFGALRRQLEMIAASSFDQSQISHELEACVEDWKSIEERAPVLAQRFHDVALRIVVPQRASERSSV